MRLMSGHSTMSMTSEDDPNPLSPMNLPNGDDTQEKNYPSGIGRDKIFQIIDACTKTQDVGQLIALSTATGGLVSDEVRRVACTLYIINIVQHGLHCV